MSNTKKVATYQALRTQLETLKTKYSWDILITINYLIKLINTELWEENINDILCEWLWICN
jgi:hypothetical protein